jgi:hypothetical protein
LAFRRALRSGHQCQSVCLASGQGPVRLRGKKRARAFCTSPF